MRCAMDDASNSIGCMAQRDWQALESLPEIDYRRDGVDGWERLRQSAIGTGVAREACLSYLANGGRRAAGWSVAVIADLMR
jgi:hypothetical protein